MHKSNIQTKNEKIAGHYSPFFLTAIVAESVCPVCGSLAEMRSSPDFKKQTTKKIIRVRVYYDVIHSLL